MNMLSDASSILATSTRYLSRLVLDFSLDDSPRLAGFFIALNYGDYDGEVKNIEKLHRI